MIMFNKILSFTGDSGLCESIKDVLQISDIIITDCTLRVGNNKHIGVDNVKDMLNDFPKVKIIPTGEVAFGKAISSITSSKSS